MFRYCRMSMVAICLIAAAAAVMLTPQPAAAQILYGSLTGNVTDQQKAAMPGVTVTAINTGTNVATEAVTDASGSYTIRNLPPGIYSLRVDATTVPAGYTATTGGVVSVTVAAGGTDLSADFGYKGSVLAISKTSSAGGSSR